MFKLFALASCAVLIATAAAAAADPPAPVILAPAAAPASGTLANPAPSAKPATPAKPAHEALICVTEEVTGSHLGGGRHCYPKSDYEARQYEARKAVDESTRNKTFETH